MKTKYFLIASALTLLLLSGGCNKDNNPNNVVPLNAGCDRSKSWGEQTKTEVDALNWALAAMAFSPSKVNCEALKIAYIEYLDALEKVNTCVIGEHEAAFLQALKNGKAELELLDCNQDFDG